MLIFDNIVREKLVKKLKDLNYTECEIEEKIDSVLTKYAEQMSELLFDDIVSIDSLN